MRNRDRTKRESMQTNTKPAAKRNFGAMVVEKLERNRMIQSIRNGLVMAIPILMVGSFSLILQTLPIAAYQSFITTFASGILVKILDFIHHGTFGFLSVFMAFSIGYSCAQQFSEGNEPGFTGGVVALACFAIFSGFLSDGFTTDFFGAKGMFSAIFSAVTCVPLFMWLSRKIPLRHLYTEGADSVFNSAMGAIIPAMLTIAIAAVFNLLIGLLFSVSSLQVLFIMGADLFFAHMGPSLLSGALFVLFNSVMWFFGVHGSDVLEGVSQSVFVPGLAMNQAAEIPTVIFTKEFFDVFALMGGCGATFSLLIALLLFSRHVGNRKLAMLSAVPMTFNINETIVFGLPIVFNPSFFIPFLLTPLVCVFTSYAAMALGLVPLVTHSVKWTTPILLGGYIATGSIAGSLLQLFNLGVGVLIYAPFVRLYDKQKFRETKHKLSDLVDLLKAHEEDNLPITLTRHPGVLGAVAKTMAMDLSRALEIGELALYYQPEYNVHGDCVGAEALLRWRHPTAGMVYPPLIIKLADEISLLEKLEQYVLRQAAHDLSRTQKSPGLRLSANVTVKTLQSPSFVPFLQDLSVEYPLAHRFGLEITEQIVLRIDSRMQKQLEAIRALGISLAIDDFSMGSTSLKYLQSSQFDVVKLDGKLVRNIAEESSSQSIVDSIIHLSRALGFMVLAEYVETQSQRNKLSELGCHLFQGYLFSPAVPYDEFAKLIGKTFPPEREEAAEQRPLDEL